MVAYEDGITHGWGVHCGHIAYVDMFEILTGAPSLVMIKINFHCAAYAIEILEGKKMINLNHTWTQSKSQREFEAIATCFY